MLLLFSTKEESRPRRTETWGEAFVVGVREQFLDLSKQKEISRLSQ